MNKTHCSILAVSASLGFIAVFALSVLASNNATSKEATFVVMDGVFD